MNDLVSIIMPSYNTGKYIRKSIQSVLDQTYHNWELIIVDDCSTDATDEIIASICDSRIIYFKNKHNCGAAVSRNRALREAKGKWIAFLDSDDIWYPQKLEKQISFMKAHNYHFSYTKYVEIDSEDNETGISVSGPRKITKNAMYNYCWPGCLTVMYDSELIGLIQIVDIKKNNDYAMWLKVCQRADCYLFDEPLAKYRRGRIGSVSSYGILTMIKWHYKLFHEAEGKCIAESIFCTCKNICFGCLKKIVYVYHRKA